MSKLKAAPNDDGVLVPFAKEHLEGAWQLWQEMFWPYRLDDWAVALELGQGFVLLDRAGRVIATAAWWAQGDDHFSAGMIIVAKAAQGRGHGARLMDALMEAAHPRTITLNSTAEGLALYDRRGLVRIGAIQVTGWSRRQMLDRLVQASDGHVLRRDGKPRGCAISRLFGRGHVIGPVVAADARALVETALARLGQVFASVDTAATSKLGEWLESIGLRPVGDATTMVRTPGTPP